MLADAVMVPRHGSRSFRGRRDAIVYALEDLESSDPEALSQVISEAAFGPGHPYARSPYGTFASLAPMGVEEAAQQQEMVLVPAGATLLIVGDVQADQTLAAARAAFGRWIGPATPQPRVPPPTVPANAAEISWLERHSASTLVACATRPLPDVHGSDAALDVLAAMLGQGMGSRLGTALRERNGLTYWANAHIVHRRQARAFMACSSLRADQADLGVRLFRGVLDETRGALPNEEELQRAKAQRLAQLDSAWENAFAISRTWERAIALGNGTPRIEQERAEIEKVTAKEVQKVAREVLSLKTTRWVFSGEKQAASHAVDANHLGRLRQISPGL
jgi:zinc protease